MYVNIRKTVACHLRKQFFARTLIYAVHLQFSFAHKATILKLPVDNWKMEKRCQTKQVSRESWRKDEHWIFTNRLSGVLSKADIEFSSSSNMDIIFLTCISIFRIGKSQLVIWSTAATGNFTSLVHEYLCIFLYSCNSDYTHRMAKQFVYLGLFWFFILPWWPYTERFSITIVFHESVSESRRISHRSRHCIITKDQSVIVFFLLPLPYIQTPNQCEIHTALVLNEFSWRNFQFCRNQFCIAAAYI